MNELFRNISKVYTKNDFNKIKDYEIKEISKSYDYVILINNTRKFVENESILKNEFNKIKKLKVSFEQTNNIMLQENHLINSDTMQETINPMYYNMNLIRTLKGRNVDFTHKDMIYLEQEEQEELQDIKSYLLNCALSYQYNEDFEEIVRRLKKAISSNNTTFTTIKPIFSMTSFVTKEKVLFIFNDLTFNNELFHKDLSLLFTPRFAQRMPYLFDSIAYDSTKKIKNGYSLNIYNEKMIHLQNM